MLSIPILKPTTCLKDHNQHSASSSPLDGATQFSVLPSNKLPQNKQFNRSGKQNDSETFTENPPTEKFQHVLQSNNKEISVILCAIFLLFQPKTNVLKKFDGATTKKKCFQLL